MAVNVVKASRSMVKAFTAVTNSIIRFSNALGSATNIYEKMFGDKRTIESINKEIASTVQQLEMLANISKGNVPLIASQAPQVAQLELTILALKELISTGEVLSTNLITPQIDDSAALEILDSLEARLSKITDSNVVTDVSTTGSTLVDLTPKPTADKHAREYEQALDHDRRMVEFRKKIAAREEMDRNKSIELTHQYLAKQSAIQKAAKQKDFGDLKEEGKNTLSALSGSYKAAFDLNKSFALKDALINTYKSVSTALASVPFPLNLGFAAIALANGMAQVQSIRSTQFRANGGPMSAGSPYIVGERGPELVVPNQAANVVPNSQLGGGNFTINISANDTAGFDELLTKRRGTLMNIINQSLNERGRPALA